MSPKLSILGLLSTVVLFPIASQGAAIDYTFTDLGTLGGTDSQGFAVNESRQVAGVSSAIKGEVFPLHATLWNGGTATDLVTSSGNYSYAFAINDAGQVAGLAYPGENFHATVWNGTILTDLGALAGGDDSQAMAINNAGRRLCRHR